MRQSILTVAAATLLVAGVMSSAMYLPTQAWLLSDGPRGYLLPQDCPICCQDYRRGVVSEPHGHVVFYIEPADKLRRDGDVWRFKWMGRDSAAGNKAVFFLPSNQPPHPAYVAVKEGRIHEYEDVLFGP